MYISILKSRMQEHNIINDYGYIYETNKLMPLIEIIELKFGRKVVTEKELLNIYDQTINSNYFVDFFTFDEDKYKPYDNTKTLYSLNMRTEDLKSYFNRLMITKNSNKAIPVISLNKVRSHILSREDIIFLISELQKHKDQIGVRLEGELFENYFDIINDNLRTSDFLFFDINEETLDPFVLELMEIKSSNDYFKILTYAPRKRKLNNGSYMKSAYTDLINCFGREKYKELGFSGYADYAGLKDDLPKDGGSGQGAALAMLYNHNHNKFYTITNHDTKKGVKGYEEVIKTMFKPEIKLKLDATNCLAYEFVNERMVKREKNGNWSQWNYIAMLRVLSEMKKVYK